MSSPNPSNYGSIHSSANGDAKKRAERRHLHASLESLDVGPHAFRASSFNSTPTPQAQDANPNSPQQAPLLHTLSTKVIDNLTLSTPQDNVPLLDKKSGEENVMVEKKNERNNESKYIPSVLHKLCIMIYEYGHIDSDTHFIP